MKRATDIIQSKWIRLMVLALMTTITISFHYKGMSQSDVVIQGLFRQFCYLPILLAALWFGLRGGLANAAVIVMVVAPLMIHKHTHHGEAIAQEALEYVYYFLFGGVFGYLSDRERAAQRKREELAVRVAHMEHLSAIGELAAGLAHEIKNPMGSIKGAAEIIEPELPQGHPKREFLNILIEEVDRLNKVVENFLAYARPLNLEKTMIEPGPVLEAVATQLRMGAPAEMDIQVEADHGLSIMADENLMRQVFLNLGLNAIEAMEDKGRLQIRVHLNGDSILIDFNDTGPGVPAEERKKIFMPFTSSKAAGSGLGLTISERIVTAHGGAIEALEGAHGGSTFRISLPKEE